MELEGEGVEGRKIIEGSRVREVTDSQSTGPTGPSGVYRK